MPSQAPQTPEPAAAAPRRSRGGRTHFTDGFVDRLLAENTLNDSPGVEPDEMRDSKCE